MFNRIALTAVALCAAVAANADTFASFFDTGATSFLRTPTSGSQGTLMGGGGNYTLTTTGGTYTGVTFAFDSPVDYFATGSGLQDSALTGPGSITISQGTTTLLTFTFQSATLNSAGFSAHYNSNPTLDDHVVFTGGSILNGIQLDPVNPQTGFDFSFSNGGPAGNGYGYSSAFSASANFQPVPEPASMAALALGAATLLRRKKK